MEKKNPAQKSPSRMRLKGKLLTTLVCFGEARSCFEDGLKGQQKENQSHGAPNAKAVTHDIKGVGPTFDCAVEQLELSPIFSRSLGQSEKVEA